MGDGVKIEAVIFDLGRVIVDIDISVLMSLIIDDPSDADVERTIVSAMDDELMLAFNRGQVGAEEFHERLIAKYNLQVPYREFVELWCGIFSPMAGMAELLGELAGKVKLGLLSDTDCLHWGHIKSNYPVLSVIDKPTLSFEVGVTKPDAAIYLTAAKNVNALPEECLFVDDLARNVEGAIAVGMDAVVFRSAEQIRTELVERKII